MPYIRTEDDAASRSPFAARGPKTREGFAAPAHTDEDPARRIDRTRVVVIEWDRAMRILSAARRAADVWMNEQEVAARHGVYLSAVRRDIELVGREVSLERDFAPGGTMVVPARLWSEIGRLIAELRPRFDAIAEEAKPVRLEVRNGETVEEAHARGVLYDTQRTSR